MEPQTQFAPPSAFGETMAVEKQPVSIAQPIVRPYGIPTWTYVLIGIVVVIVVIIALVMWFRSRAQAGEIEEYKAKLLERDDRIQRLAASLQKNAWAQQVLVPSENPAVDEQVKKAALVQEAEKRKAQMPEPQDQYTFDADGLV